MTAGSALKATDLWSVSMVNSRSMISPFNCTGWNSSVGIMAQCGERSGAEKEQAQGESTLSLSASGVIK